MTRAISCPAGVAAAIGALALAGCGGDDEGEVASAAAGDDFRGTRFESKAARSGGGGAPANQGGSYGC
jgi:hypothetical protein